MSAWYGLPVCPDQATDACFKAYVAELKAAITPDRLRAFATRWQTLWELPIGGLQQLMLGTEKQIPLGAFDASRVLRCIERGRAGLCQHAKRNQLCVGSALLLPTPWILAEEIVHLYGITHDLALIQLVERSKTK